MKSIVLGTLLGGFTLVAWSAISWLALPWHMAGFRSFSNEEALTQTLVAGAREAGMYTIPRMESGSAAQRQSTADKLVRGPLVFASVRPGPLESTFALFVRQFLIQLATAFVLTLLLLRTGTGGFARRVWFVAGIGLAGGIAGHLPNWNWWSFAPGYTAVEVADMVIGFALAGCVMAAVIPEMASEQAPKPVARRQSARTAGAS